MARMSVKPRFSLPSSNWIVQQKLQSGASRRFIPSPLEFLELREIATLATQATQATLATQPLPPETSNEVGELPTSAARKHAMPFGPNVNGLGFKGLHKKNK